MIEVAVEAIQVSLISSHRVVVLKQVGGNRRLPIWIGPCEAEAISIGAKGIEVLRPLTHNLIINVLNALGADLLYIFINDLADNTFYAKLVVSVGDRELEIDSRPSDAIAIAVRTGVPIYVAESVLDEAGVVPERDILTDRSSDLESLNVFRDFLRSLDLDEPRETG